MNQMQDLELELDLNHLNYNPYKKIKKMDDQQNTQIIQQYNNHAIIPNLSQDTKSIQRDTLYQNFRVSRRRKNNEEIIKNTKQQFQKYLNIEIKCSIDKILYFSEIFDGDFELQMKFIQSHPQACYNLMMNVQI